MPKMNGAVRSVVMAATFLIACADSFQARAVGGLPVWTNYYGQTGVGVTVAVDRAGNAFVTGFDYATIFPDIVTIKYSSSGVPVWTNRYNGPGSSDDEPTALAVDDKGTVFLTGTTGILGEPGDYLTLAVSNDGLLLWARSYNGPGKKRDYPRALVLDKNGNVFVTGSTDSGTSTDYATVAYSNSGAPLWTNLYNRLGSDSDAALAVATDAGGKVFVTGGSMPDANSRQYATVAYSATGARLWADLYNGPGTGFCDGRAIAVDKDGNIFVTGNAAGTGTTNDLTTIAYSNSGVPLWTNRYNGPGNDVDSGNAIGVDDNGIVFITGNSTGAGSGFDYATIAYSNSGVPLWTNRYDGPGNGYDVPFALGLDGDGNVFVTGSSIDVDGSYAYATLAYSNAGVPLWTNRYTYGISGPRVAKLAVDATGNVFVTVAWGAAAQGVTSRLSIHPACGLIWKFEERKIRSF